MENFETYRLDQTGQQTQAILDQVSTNTADIAQLRALYEALTQSEPVIIQPSDTWPVVDPQENVIYRVIDRVNTPPQSYSDYMWNGTAMVLMATYNNTIDNEPTPGSNNLVKSGGVAASIVFDISAYHATGSTLATYANLAAALGTDGANVPASVRKGGMSIKFVQSSDNKYVQFRYMGTEVTGTPNPFLNTDNWFLCDNNVLENIPEYIHAIVDKNRKIIIGIRNDGTVFIPYFNNPQIENKLLQQDEILSFFEYKDADEWKYLITDKNNKILFGIRCDGEIIFGIGVPESFKEYVRDFFKDEDNLPIVVGGSTPNDSYLVVGRGNEGAKMPYCVALGIDVLTNNTGIKNMTVGEDNMRDNTGHDNTSMGYHAMFRNTSGIVNSGFGSEALDDNLSGTHNTGVGFCALQRNNTGNHNAALGAFALNGDFNDSFDPEHLKYYSQNTAVGAQAMMYAATGSGDNVAVGFNALPQKKVYRNCIAIGSNADCDKDYQAVLGNDNTQETVVRGELIVKATDGTKRQIVFNNDGTCSWVLVQQ